MKKAARKSRYKSPTKRVGFRAAAAAAAAAAETEVTAAPATLSGYVRQVRRALRGRLDDYREFAEIVADLRRQSATVGDSCRQSATVGDDSAIVGRIERAVCLLDGQPELIAALRMFLPAHYHIDVQSDAVVVKVTVCKLHVSCSVPHLLFCSQLIDVGGVA